MRKLSPTVGKKLMKSRTVTDGKPNIFVSRKTKNLVLQMPNGDVFEGNLYDDVVVTTHGRITCCCEQAWCFRIQHGVRVFPTVQPSMGTNSDRVELINAG